MDDTFNTMVGYLRQFVPDVPVGLAQQLIRNAYRQLLDWPTDMWSFQVGQAQMICHGSLMGTCSVIQGLSLVQASSIALPGDRTTIVGRQVLFGGQAPIYSIVDNPASANFLMDEGYGGVTGTIAFEITNIYFTPVDRAFERILSFTDPPNSVQLPTSFTLEELNNVDAQRSASGTPYLLADVGFNDAYLAQLPSGVTDSFGQTNASTPVLRKEIYPRNQANYNYRYFYKKWIPDLTPANQTPIAFFARRGDIVVRRALADLDMWEGPENVGKKANPVAHNIHMKEFQDMAQDLQIKDQGMSQRSYTTYLSMTRLPFPQALAGSSFAMLHPALDSDVGVPFGDIW